MKNRIGVFLLILWSILFWTCKEHVPAKQPVAKTPLELLRYYYKNSKYDTAYLYVQPVLESMKRAGQWDSIYFYAESFTIILNYQQKFAEGYQFLEELEQHYVQASPVDSARLAGIWVRRSDLLKETGNYQAALDTNFAALNLRKRLFRYPHLAYTDSYDYLNMSYAVAGDFWNAIKYGELGIQSFKDIGMGKSLGIGFLYANTAEAYLDVGEFNKALDYKIQAFELLKPYNGADHFWATDQMNGIAAVYYAKGDYQKCIELAEKAMLRFAELNITLYQVAALELLAKAHMALGDKSKMMQYGKQQYDLLKLKSGEEHLSVINSATLLARCYLKDQNPILAQKYLQEATRVSMVNNFIDKSEYYEVIAMEGERFRMIERYDSALICSRKVMEFSKKFFGSQNDHFGVKLLSYGKDLQLNRAYMDSNAALSEAIVILSKTRGALHPMVVEAKILQIQNGQQLQHFGDSHQLLERTMGAIRTQLRSDPTASSPLRLHYAQLLSLQSKALNRSGTQADKALIVMDTALGIYAKAQKQQNFSIDAFGVEDNYDYAIDLAVTNWKRTNNERFLKKALQYSEQRKSVNLRQAIQQQIADKFADVPDSVLSKEKTLKLNIKGYWALIEGAKIKHAPATKVQIWNDSIVNLQRDYSKLQQLLERDYPRYFQLKYQESTIQPELLLKSLDQNEAYVEFTQSDSTLSAFVIQNGKLAHHEFDVPVDTVRNWVQNLKTTMQSNSKAQFEVILSNLYEKLWKPLAINKSRVCVIPDGFLYYLNFESLIVRQTENKPNFLIESVEFRYANSLSELHLYDQLKYEGQPSELLAFSPGFDDLLKGRSENRQDEFFKHLLRQPWAIATSELLHKKFGATAFIREQATEDKVKNIQSPNGVVYFGTHAFLNNDDPLFSRLVLAKSDVPSDWSDGYLYSYEIYGCTLNLNTIILSACQTGLGKLQNGNGMASIASSFNYAGCKTVLMSLWSIDDEKSAEIIQKFYAYLGQGHLKSEALRLAKLDYLRSADSELSSPFYWSGLVMLGENNAVTFAIPSMWERYGWWLVLAGVVGGIVIAAAKYRWRHW